MTYYIHLQSIAVDAGCEDEAVTKMYRMIREDPSRVSIEDVECEEDL